MKGLLIFEKVQLLNKKLENLLIENLIRKYRIRPLLSSDIEIDVLVENKNKIEYSKFEEFEGLNNYVRVNEWDEDELENWRIEDMFALKIDKSARRRLSNLIDLKDSQDDLPCPVVTFYSYKGGVGRTTTLAFFASWLATNHSKKVIIIDCDFEAPGFSNSNFFDLNREEKKGIVEFFLDSEFAIRTGEKLDILKDYAYQVRPEYVGTGDIFIIPSGNLSLEKNDNNISSKREEYIEALARLDITSIDHILKQFKDFFKALKLQLNLDYDNSIILIDSRTGFNDTFAILSALSNIIVGFFGNNQQSKIGLTEFLNNFGTIENKLNKQLVIVNSISSSKFERPFKEFIKNYIDDNPDKFRDEEQGSVIFGDKIFRIDRVGFLEEIGTELENKDIINGSSQLHSSEKLGIDFIRNVKRPPLEFEDLFNELNGQITQQIEESKSINVSNEEEKLEEGELHKSNTIFNSEILEDAKKEPRTKIRERLLRTLIDDENFPKLYADTEVPKLEDFYFRESMKGIFNRDMFLIVGYKGTGKTHIYQSFKNPEITNRLCNKYNENVSRYIFINVVPVHDRVNKDSYFDTSAKFSRESIEQVGSNFFYERFWLAYVWASIFNSDNIKKLSYNFAISQNPIPVINDNTTYNWFQNIIKNDALVLGIEQDFKNLDNFLIQKDKTIILSFDELDFIVKPDEWSKGVAPLIKYWRNNIFSRIHPKIFVRADLLDKMGNIVNANEMQEKTISLQWSKEELFAYFLKFVFKSCKIDFLKLCYSFGDFTEKRKQDIIKINESLDSDMQIPISDVTALKFLVDNFFGKYADRFDSYSSTYGESYEWFYRNLTDAKNTISIRPFLDLIHKSIIIALEDVNLKKEKQGRRIDKVLSASYYTSKKSKEFCVERYYTDLAGDPGNEFLNLFYRYLKSDGLAKYRVYEFRRELFDEMLRAIKNREAYKNEKSIKDKTIDELRNILVNNGIVMVSQKGYNRLTFYTIPYLYRDYLNVSKPDELDNFTKKS